MGLFLVVEELQDGEQSLMNTLGDIKYYVMLRMENICCLLLLIYTAVSVSGSEDGRKVGIIE